MQERDREAVLWEWTRTRVIAAAVLFFPLALPAAGDPAQETPGATATSQTRPDAEAAPTAPGAIARRSAALAEEIDAAERSLATASEGSERSHAEERLDRLRRIAAALREQTEAAAHPSTQTPDEIETSAASVFELNRLYEAQFELETDRERQTDLLAVRRAALANARKKLEEAERRRREARHALEAPSDAGARRQAERRLELRRLESRIAQERVNLQTLEVRLAQQERDSADLVDLAERIDRMREALTRGEGESLVGLSALAEREGALRREREAAERRLATIELRLEAAQQRFSRQLDPPQHLLEEIEALRARRDLIRQEISLVDARIERLAGQRVLWRQWDAALGGAGTREELETWKEAVGERLQALEESSLERQGERADLEQRLQSIDNRLARSSEAAAVRPVLEEQRAVLSRLLEAERVEAIDLAQDRRMSERVLEELRDRTGVIDPLQYVSWAASSVRDTWNYEITTVDDSPITVGSLVLALLLALVGFWASRRGSVLVGRFATQRFRLDTGAADALQTLSFYVLLVSFTILALRVVHFPLTAFTVLGGALAIGIGFGSQNVMNNFISGLILMLERPIRAGDVVEVHDNHGTVEKIGARSTQIRSVNGRHIVVPNSFFLENNVVNWTLSDDLIRTSVLVGVIYGSPTRLVRDLILRVVAENGEILKNPEPIIVFDEFGDNSLNFEVHFWVRSRTPMGMRKVQSDVRFAIDDVFREHDLVIAFPQRDVHLDSVSPIEVRVVDRDNPDAKAG